MNLGFINLNKPAGYTSHDCVARVRRILNTKKVGHGGTLDPAATGVLPIAVGKATRLLQFLPTTKAYRARIRLGMQTTTDDLEGEIIATQPNMAIAKTEIEAHLSKFIGTIEQIPPIYSAIKKQGKKLYELARAGEKVDVPPRTVKIDTIELLNIMPGKFTEVEIAIRCSPGTYIRSIARDLGEMLGVGATLANLVRTESCGMQLANSITLSQLAAEFSANSGTLISPMQALSHLPKVSLNSEQVKPWCQGQTVEIYPQKYGENQLINENQKLFELQDYYLTVTSKNNFFLGISICLNEDYPLVIAPKIVCAIL
ncbi:MAG: tRNA pseudouridine(55) synthase TruB [Xenococcaceae cyanobacterium]